MLKDCIYNAPKYAGVYEIRNDEHMVYVGYALKLRQSLIKLYQDKIFDKLDTESAKLELKFVQQNSHEPNLEFTLITKANELIKQYKELSDIILISDKPYELINKSEAVSVNTSRPNWRKVLDIATGYWTIKGSDKMADITTENISELFKDYTSCITVDAYQEFIVIDNRFIFMPYDIDENSNENLKLLKQYLLDKAYFEMDGYIHTDLLAGLIDIYIQHPEFPVNLVAQMLKKDESAIQGMVERAKKDAKDNVYVPWKSFAEYYKLHSSDEIKAHFNLTDEQYKKVLRKFYIMYFVTDIDGNRIES